MTKLTLEEKKVQALAEFLEIETEDFSGAASYDECLFNADGGEYLVLTDEEADRRVADYIRDSIWAFNAEFIIGECGLDFSGADSLRKMQAESCEGANDFLLSLVEKTCGLEDFTESAIRADGRGHFLAFYDGEENEINLDGEWFYIYRVN